MYRTVDEVFTDNEGYEIQTHGNLSYPVACYYNDMSTALVIWHWHEELELIVVKKGIVKIGAGSAEEILHEGDGCFINSGVPHSVWKVDMQEGIINSIVFHPKLIGGRHSIYWQKYIQPLITNEKQQFIFFSSKQTKDNHVINIIQSAWQAEADENFGFEFEWFFRAKYINLYLPP